ncbi:MAG TPA: choice-of-anchor N protein [Candidatus Deferrimicrobium sp.]|nr:choice-of-anchor N protein [Candidatus Deferrimicrobium sp.]
MKKAPLIFLSAIVLAPVAYCVPALQLYSPGATYDFNTDTWVMNASDFELWVIAANTNVNRLYGVRLVVALASGDTPVDGGISVNGASLMASAFKFGVPPMADDSGTMPTHGIYPTYFAEFFIGNILNAPETVYDMQPGQTGSAPGKTFKYQVSTSYDFVHFDAFGYYDPYKFKFAPFSHDAEYAIPEPGSFLLLTLGLLGTGIIRRRRRN